MNCSVTFVEITYQSKLTSLSVIHFISAAGGGVEQRKCYPDPCLWTEITEPVKRALWPRSLRSPRHCAETLLSTSCFKKKKKKSLHGGNVTVGHFGNYFS